MNEEIEYSDDEQNEVKFPDPKVYVDCGEVVRPDPCPEPREICLRGCEDAVEAELGDLFIASPGRIVELNVNIRAVCPHKRVALAVLLEDCFEGGFRSLKTFTLPAHCGSGCRDLRVEGIRFAGPDSVCHCQKRRMRVSLLANYMDTDSGD